MTALPTHIIDPILAPHGDALDTSRAELKEALDAGAPGARKQAFEFANEYWATIATEAWNEGERSQEIHTICNEVKRLCNWINETPRTEAEDRYDSGGAVTTAGMMLYVLGDTDGAIEHFQEIIARPVNSYFHESTHEKLISTLIKDDRTDEALTAIDALLEAYPHNTFGQNCRDAYAADQAGGQSGGGSEDKIDHETYSKVTTALSAQFSSDMEKLMAQGLPPAEMQVRMNDAQKAFQSTMELMSRLL